MRLLELLSGRTKTGCRVIARYSDFKKAGTLDGTSYPTHEEAQAAVETHWPDVTLGPEFGLSGAGHQIAAAINRYELQWASDENEEPVWLLVVDAKEAVNARRALKRLLKYWEAKHSKSPFS